MAKRKTAGRGTRHDADARRGTARDDDERDQLDDDDDDENGDDDEHAEDESEGETARPLGRQQNAHTRIDDLETLVKRIALQVGVPI